MSKKRTKSPAPKPEAKQADAAYPVSQDELDEQQGRLRKAAAAGADVLKTPGTSAEAAQPLTAAASSKPPTPVAALWPDAIPATGNSKSAHTHVGETKATPVTATPPKVPPALEPARPPVLSAPPTLPEKPAPSVSRKCSTTELTAPLESTLRNCFCLSAMVGLFQKSHRRARRFQEHPLAVTRVQRPAGYQAKRVKQVQGNAPIQHGRRKQAKPQPRHPAADGIAMKPL